MTVCYSLASHPSYTMNHVNGTAKTVSNGLICEEKGNLAPFPHRLSVSNGKNHGNRQLALFFEREFRTNIGDSVAKFEDKNYKWSPAHWAAYFGDLPCLHSLFSLVGTSLLDDGNSTFNQTPLHVAAFAGQNECVEWMIQQGSNVNKMDCLNETALHKCARTGNVSCAIFLLSHGANEQMMNKDGLTAQRMSIVCGHEDLGLQMTGQTNGTNGFYRVHSSVLSSSLIRQGLNGGHLPDSIPDDDLMEVEGNHHHPNDIFVSIARKRSSCDEGVNGCSDGNKIKRMRSHEEAPCSVDMNGIPGGQDPFITFNNYQSPFDSIINYQPSPFNGSSIHGPNAAAANIQCNGVNGTLPFILDNGIHLNGESASSHCNGQQVINESLSNGVLPTDISIYAYSTLLAEMHGS